MLSCMLLPWHSSIQQHTLGKTWCLTVVLSSIADPVGDVGAYQRADSRVNT